MIPVPEQYANKPNLWRVACELAKFREPYVSANDKMKGNAEEKM